MYQLITPFKSRRDGVDVEYTELPVPEVVTVAMMRRLPVGSELIFAHGLAEICAGLNAFEAAKLTTPDAIGYTDFIAELITAFDEPGFEIPEIKPVKALVAKITASVSQSVEFAAQVLQHSGMKRELINAMDIRAFLPAVEAIKEAVISPKN